MKFTVTEARGAVLGTIEVTEEVYLDDVALLQVLADAGYVDHSEVLEVTEQEDNQVDIFEYETNAHRLSLVLIH